MYRYKSVSIFYIKISLLDSFEIIKKQDKNAPHLNLFFLILIKIK